MNNALLHAMNKTHTFIDVESGQFISLPKDETDKPPVNADINGLQFFGKSTQDGEPSPDNPVDIINTPPELDLTVWGRNLLDITKAYNRDPTYTSFVIVGNSLTAMLLTGSAQYVRLIIPIFLSAGTYTIKNNYTRTGLYGGSIYLHNQLDSELLYIFKIGVHTFTVNNSKIYYLRLNMTTGIAGTIGDTVTWSNLEIIKGTYTAETMPPYQPYQDSTYPYHLEDLDGNLYELCSLPDGTRDEYDRDNGVLIKRVKRLTVTSGTTSEPNNIVPYYWSATDTIAGIVWSDNQNKWTHFIGEQINIRCSHAEHSPAIYARIPGTCDFNATANVTQLEMFFLKSDITDAGFTLDSAGVQAYVNKIIADTGKPITFLYPYSEPQIIPIKQYGKTYDGQVWLYNQKPKSIQYHTNIFTDNDIDMQCEVRKLGNRAMGTFNWVTENGDKIITENGDYIMFEY